jgi:cytosine/adenosine deaminase-related metal-dependent hydrolase
VSLASTHTTSGALLLRGGSILTSDGDLRIADVLINDGRIAAIGDLSAEPGTQSIDATGRLVLPGLIDTHRHTWQSAVRGIGTGWDLNAYFGAMFFGIAPHYTADDVYVGTLLGALTALDAGITTMVDWSHIQNTPGHADAGIQALQDSGIRAVFAHGWPQNDDATRAIDSTQPHPEDARRIREKSLGDDDARVTMSLALRGPEFTSRETFESDMQLAKDLDLRVTMHVGNGEYGPRYRAVALLHELGLLGPHITLVHTATSSDEEFRMIADSGARVSVSPHLETTMPGIGRPSTGRLLKAGIRPSLSVDTETAVAGDMFTVMRATLATHRADQNDPDPHPLEAADVFSFATREGAAAAGLAGRAGVLDVGYAADVIVVRSDDVNLAPDPTLGTIVASAHAGNVDTVIVDGVIRKRDGRLSYPHLPDLLGNAASSRQRLLTYLPG